jgi:ribosomal protein S12 methylthiotransferase
MLQTNSKTIFFQSLGCPKNLVDAEVMLGITKEHNYKFVEDPSQAEVIVVNTCSFINDSKRESINTVLELSENKKSGICDKLIVTGCLPQRYKEDLKVAFPEVDAFVGTGQYGHILEFIEGKKESDEGFKHPKYLHNENTNPLMIHACLVYRNWLQLQSSSRRRQRGPRPRGTTHPSRTCSR